MSVPVALEIHRLKRHYSSPLKADFTKHWQSILNLMREKASEKDL